MTRARPLIFVLALALVIAAAWRVLVVPYRDQREIMGELGAMREEQTLPTQEQLLQLHLARKLEWMDLRISQLQTAQAASKPVRRGKPATRAAKEPQRPPDTGVWSVAAERSRRAWAKWADAELRRLQAERRQ